MNSNFAAIIDEPSRLEREIEALAHDKGARA
jgi:hypothetical protein